MQKAEKSIDAGISEVRRRLEDDGNQATTADDDGDTGPGIVSYNVNSSRASSAWYNPHDSPADDEEDEDNDIEPRVGLLVADRCRRTVREFLGYKEDHVGTSQAEDHCLDSLRYVIMGVTSDGTTSGRRG